MIPSEITDVAQLGMFPLLFWLLQKLTAIQSTLTQLPCMIDRRGCPARKKERQLEVVNEKKIG